MKKLYKNLTLTIQQESFWYDHNNDQQANDIFSLYMSTKEVTTFLENGFYLASQNNLKSFQNALMAG